MMENHSFDDHFGMLGRGDGFKLDSPGKPLDANPDGRRDAPARVPHAVDVPAATRTPGQNWVASHTSFDGGRNDGFVTARAVPVAMGYWDETDIPFYYGLASTFPLCDRYFCSVLAQTYPNRRFLHRGYRVGRRQHQYIRTSTSSARPNGTILDRLHAHGITGATTTPTFPASR